MRRVCREIIHFAAAPSESATAWRQVLEAPRQRGLQDVDFIVADGFAGLAEAAAEIFPSAQFQLWAGEGKNLLSKVRARDRAALAYDLKLIYKAENQQAAKEAFTLFKLLWSRKYPKVVESLEKDLSSLLSFMKAPPQV